MNKIINVPSPEVKANFNDKEYDHSTQVKVVNKMFVGEKETLENDFWREINKKITSYKTQDVNKKKYDQNLFIKKEEVLEKLVTSKLTCYYCLAPVYIIYKHVRQNDQWTLERLDNSIGHHNENVVISCLKCNLKRRTSNHNYFKFTKQLKINKIKA